MKCLLVGGAGFIGRNLTLELCSRNHLVSILDDFGRTGRPDFFDFLQRENCKFVTFIKVWYENILTNNSDSFWSTVLKDVDVIFHLAAFTSVSDSWNKIEEFEKNNVLGTLRILEQARKNNVKKVVFVSSASVYGQPETDLVPMNTKIGPYDGWLEITQLKPIHPYGITKKIGEEYCLLFQSLGVDCIIARLSNVYGPEQPYSMGYHSVIPTFLYASTQNKSPIIHGDGKQRRDFVFVKDVVYALTRLAEQNKTGIFNIGSGQPLEIIELFNKMKKINSQWLVLPIFKEKRKGDVDINFVNINKLKSVLGDFPIHSLKEGLQKCIGLKI